MPEKANEQLPQSSDGAGTERLGQPSPEEPALASGGPKCTPGPWEVRTPPDHDDPDWSDEYPRETSVRSHWNPPRKGTVGYEICSMSGVSSETLPNAHLIAAAPDLYEALDELSDQCCDDPVFTDKVIKARAALAKARGEQNAR